MTRNLYMSSLTRILFLPYAQGPKFNKCYHKENSKDGKIDQNASVIDQ